MQTQTFIVDVNNKQEVESAMEKMLFMFKVNQGRKEVDAKKYVSQERIKITAS